MVRVGRVGQVLLLGLFACGAQAAEPTTGFYIGAGVGAPNTTSTTAVRKTRSWSGSEVSAAAS